jgi:hypothetical protein
VTLLAVAHGTKVELALLGAYAMFGFGGSFRNHDVFLVDTLIY